MRIKLFKWGVSIYYKKVRDEYGTEDYSIGLSFQFTERYRADFYKWKFDGQPTWVLCIGKLKINFYHYCDHEYFTTMDDV